MDREITIHEIMTEWKEMNDGAAVKDDIIIGMIRNFHKVIQIAIAKPVTKIAESQPDQWDKCLQEGSSKKETGRLMGTKEEFASCQWALAF